MMTPGHGPGQQGGGDWGFSEGTGLLGYVSLRIHSKDSRTPIVPTRYPVDTCGQQK